MPALLMIGVTVCRERRWISVGATPAREMVAPPVAIETTVEATKLSELSV